MKYDETLPAELCINNVTANQLQLVVKRAPSEAQF